MWIPQIFWNEWNDTEKKPKMTKAKEYIYKTSFYLAINTRKVWATRELIKSRRMSGVVHSWTYVMRQVVSRPGNMASITRSVSEVNGWPSGDVRSSTFGASQVVRRPGNMSRITKHIWSASEVDGSPSSVVYSWTDRLLRVFAASGWLKIGHSPPGVDLNVID